MITWLFLCIGAAYAGWLARDGRRGDAVLLAIVVWPIILLTWGMKLCEEDDE